MQPLSILVWAIDRKWWPNTTNCRWRTAGSGQKAIFAIVLKILIIRFSSIGDIVLTTPVLRCLKQQVPGIVVHYLTKTQFAGILSTNIYIDKVITLDDSLAETVKRLKEERYDWVIDLHHNLRTLRVKRMLGRPSKSFNKMNFAKWMLVNFKTPMPANHIVARYLDTVAHLGAKNDGLGMDYFIPPTEAPYPIPYPAYVAFAIGGQHYTKRLPNAKIIEVVQRLHYPIVLLGGNEDAANGDEITKQAGRADVLNLCGKLSLNQSAMVVRDAKALITHDTGMMHIGAALDVPIFSVWGNTVPQFGMYPYYKQGSTAAERARMFEVAELPCRPCSKIGYERCPLGHFKCMEEQDSLLIAETVLSAVCGPQSDVG